MSVFDPSLDRSPTWLQPRDEQELAMLRHDIRSAMAGVAGGIRHLADTAVDQEVRAQIERIAASARALESLVALAFGDTRAAGPVETDLDRLIAHLRHSFTGAARETGTAFRVEMDPGLPSRLRLDPLSLTRVLDNLVAAALGACRGGSVALSARQDEGEVVFRIAGERAGHGGVARAEGIGAEVARTLTERLGGRLALIGTIDGRTDATLRFPVSVTVAPAHGPVVAPRLSGVRILLAEDNPTNQMVASNMLRALDAEVVVCSDGVEALERFDVFPADLVVVDIEMPRLTGLDVIRAIRSRTDARALVPIIALTAYAMREHRDRILSAGANGLIPKPITSIEALGRELAAHLLPGPAAPGGGIGDTGPKHIGSGNSGSGGAGAAETIGGAVMDMTVFDDLCLTIGPELVDELMEKVVADLVDARVRLERALVPFERSVIESTSHILISVAGAFGAVRLQLRARALNNACRDPRVPRESIDPDVRLCITELDAAVGFARSRSGAE